MRFTPLEMTIDGDPACELASPIIGMLRCGDCDVYWSKQQIFGMYEAGILNRWHLTDATADHALYWEVSWDGRYVWLHAHGQGILAVTPDGIPVASFKGQTPPYGKGHKLIGISPGRAIMVGSFGESHRAWCGLLEVDQGESGKTSANIFFKAKHVAQKASNDQASDDIQTGFTPLALSRVTRKDGASFVLVERRGMPRLQVDLEALEVSVADDEHDSAGLSTQTDLGFAGPYFVRDGRPLHTLSGVATSPNSKQLLYHNDWLYRPGYIWTRQHAESAQLERLQSRTLPQSYWHLRVGSSAHYGLVAFDPYDSEATVFRVQILGDGKGGDTEKDATEQSGKN